MYIRVACKFIVERTKENFEKTKTFIKSVIKLSSQDMDI